MWAIAYVKPTRLEKQAERHGPPYSNEESSLILKLIHQIVLLFFIGVLKFWKEISVVMVILEHA